MIYSSDKIAKKVKQETEQVMKKLQEQSMKKLSSIKFIQTQFRFKLYRMRNRKHNSPKASPIKPIKHTHEPINDQENTRNQQTFNPTSDSKIVSPKKVTQNLSIDNVNSQERLLNQIDKETDKNAFDTMEFALHEIKANQSNTNSPVRPLPIKSDHDRINEKIDNMNGAMKDKTNINNNQSNNTHAQNDTKNSPSKYHTHITSIDESINKLNRSNLNKSRLDDVKTKFEESKTKVNQKLSNLVNFLNQEEQKTEHDIEQSFIDEKATNNNNESRLITSTGKVDFNLDDLRNEAFDCQSEIKMGNQSTNVNQDAEMQSLQNKVNSLEFELDLATKTNEDLQLVIKRVKEDKNYSLEDMQKSKELELQRTKEALQAKGKQQLELVEKLVKEKKVLLNKCEDFTRKLRAADNKNEQNIQEAELRFATEVKKLREQWAESEKQRREQFVEAKTREIKESTIKGLEPELQRIMRKSKEDLATKEREFNVQLAQEKESMMQNFEQKLNEQRNSLMSVKDNEVTQERESLSIKLKENWALYQQQLKENNDKWRDYFEKEKEKNDELRAKDAVKFELKISKLQEELEKTKLSNSENLRNLREEQEGRNKSSLAQAREQLQLENDEWRTRMLGKFKKESEAELKMTKEQLRKERDIEIEKLIVKMSEEQTSWKKEFEVKSAENEKAIRMKQLNDLKDGKRAELDLKEQVEHIRGIKLNLEDKIAELNKRILRQEQEKKDLKESYGKEEILLKNEISALQEQQTLKTNKMQQLESDMIRKNNRLELEVEDLRELNNSLKGEHMRTIDEMRIDHQKEMETIEVSIKKTIEKKNAMIEGLRAQLANEQDEKQNMKIKFEKHRSNLVNALE